ncbi:MAG: hypothetical protein R2695_14455 [Acidimicrobiales bacterium]
MPRKGPALRPSSIPIRSTTRCWSRSSSTRCSSGASLALAEKIVYGALAIVEEKTGAEPVGHAQACGRQRPSPARGAQPPGRWRHLPGPGRGSPAAGHDPRHPLDGVLLAGPASARWPKRLANEILDASNGIGASSQAP